MRVIPTRAKVGLAFWLQCARKGFCLNSRLSMSTDVKAIGVVVQQVVVGLAIGFARATGVLVCRVGWKSLASDGAQFRIIFDPPAMPKSVQWPVFGNIAMLLFIAINGHLLVVLAVVKSFERFPVNGNFLAALNQMRLYELGASLFSSALWIALPMVRYCCS